MGIRYTKAQLEAITTRGTNVLVSAGAGSGKTAVLTERVLQLLKENVAIDSLVILTFTNAAAKEMKERIRSKIIGALKDHPHLSEALKNLDTAHIQTFDSLALFMLKKYGYLQNVSKALSIGDMVRMVVVKETLVESLFEEQYAKKDAEFLDYVKTYSHRDDYTLKQQIIYFYDALSLHYDHDEITAFILSNYFTKEHFETLFKGFSTLVINQLESIKDTLSDALMMDGLEESLDHIHALDRYISPILSCEEYECLYSRVHQLGKMPNTGALTRKIKETNPEELEEVKTYQETLSKMLKDLTSVLEKSKQEHYEAFLKTKQHINVIVALVSKFKKAYTNYQIEHEIFDFQTVARLALDIVLSHEEIREGLKSSIYEVMVDEYQDTNNMQESFIKSITDNNMYMVGDIKQSIYRFRHAEPSIFIDKYLAFQKNRGGKLIDLNENFRSRKEVLKSINTVFMSVMDKTIGGVDYTDKQKLLYGNKGYDKAVSEITPYGLRLKVYDTSEYSEFFKEEISRDAAEFFTIAEEIKTRVGKDDVFDGELRKSHYGDYAILIDRKTQFDLAKQVFEYVGVPLEVHRSDTLMAFDDTKAFKNLCMCVAALNDQNLYKDHFKHAFMSVSRSVFLEASDDSIALQVLDFPSNVSQLKASVHKEFELFFETLYILNKKIKTMTLDDLLQAIVKAFDVRRKLLKLPHAAPAIRRLDYMLSQADALMLEGVHLDAFIAYINRMLESDLDLEITESKPIDESAVHLMTIHKSKGLEFPFVYFPHLYKPFNRSTMRNYDFDRRLGMLIPHEDEGLDRSFLYPYKSMIEREEAMSETLRVLYVALTRAKENYTVFLGIDSNKSKTFRVDDNDVIVAYERLKYRSFETLFTSIHDRLEPYKETLEFSEVSMDAGYLSASKQSVLRVEGIKKEYQEGTELFEVNERKTMSSGVDSVIEEDGLNNLEVGDRLHQLLEWINFYEPLEPQLNAYAKNTFEKETIKAFFDQPFMQGIELINVYKEYPFIDTKDNIKTRGFIDCLLETKEAFIVVDYKLKNIDKPHYIEQVQGYVELIQKRTDKPVKGVLYSLLDKEFKKVVV